MLVSSCMCMLIHLCMSVLLFRLVLLCMLCMLIHSAERRGPMAE